MKLSVLYRIHGDEKYPYSEAVGVLQRVEARPEGGPVYHLARRRGDVVAVPASDILKLRLLNGG